MVRNGKGPKKVQFGTVRVRTTGLPADIVPRFFAHVTARLNPHDFPGVVLSKPSADADFVWLSDEIRLPGSQVMVCCPWCSNGHPKFRTGRLLYFPDEGVMRFVGHRCAKSHLSVDKLARADDEWREKKRRETRDKFLRDNCRAVAGYKLALDHLIKIGNACDLFYDKFAALPADIHANIARYVRNGELFVEDQRSFSGMARPRVILGVLEGLEVFAKKPKLKSSLEFSRRQLLSIEADAHRARDGELSHMGQKQRDAVQALFKQAAERIFQAASKIASFQAFLRAHNIELLNAWCCHETSDIARCGIEVRLVGPHKLLFKYRERGSVGLVHIEAFPVLLGAMPHLQPLRAS